MIGAAMRHRSASNPDCAGSAVMRIGFNGSFASRTLSPIHGRTLGQATASVAQGRDTTGLDRRGRTSRGSAPAPRAATPGRSKRACHRLYHLSGAAIGLVWAGVAGAARSLFGCCATCRHGRAYGRRRTFRRFRLLPSGRRDQLRGRWRHFLVPGRQIQDRRHRHARNPWAGLRGGGRIGRAGDTAVADFDE